MCHRFGIGLAGEFAAVFGELVTQLAKIFDDTVVDDSNEISRMRMRIVFGRPAVCRPACMTDADLPTERLAIETIFERAQFAFRAPALQHTFFKGRYTGRVIAAILEALESVDQLACNRLVPENSDDPAHSSGRPLYLPFSGLRQPEVNQNAFHHVTGEGQGL